jgi:hypothetical protein
MPSVFISYARPDRAIAESLANDLTARGIDVWWDTQIDPGQNFRKAINDALDRATAVIVIWSKDSVESHWVTEEASYALQENKLVTTHVPGFNKRPIGFTQIHSEEVLALDKIYRSLARLGVATSSQASPVPHQLLLLQARLSPKENGNAAEWREFRNSCSKFFIGKYRAEDESKPPTESLLPNGIRAHVLALHADRVSPQNSAEMTHELIRLIGLDNPGYPATKKTFLYAEALADQAISQQHADTLRAIGFDAWKKLR